MQGDIISLYSIMSTVGYALLPMIVVGLVGIVFSLQNEFGICLALGMAVWCALAAGNTVKIMFKDVNNSKKHIICYPLFLFYVCFAMIIIF